MPLKLALLGGTPIRTEPFTSWPIFGKAEEKRLLRTLRSGKWGRLHGSEVAEFENRFAALHGCQHGIAVVNGTVSLRIALQAAGIRAEDEVIIPPYTFFSTASAVIEANAVPADGPLPVYAEQRHIFDGVMAAAMNGGDDPATVAKAIVVAATV